MVDSGLGRGRPVPKFLDDPLHSMLGTLGATMTWDGSDGAVSERPVQVVETSTPLDGEPDFTSSHGSGLFHSPLGGSS